MAHEYALAVLLLQLTPEEKDKEGKKGRERGGN